MPNNKKAIEIFGRPVDLVNIDKIVKSRYLCPFINRECTKQSRTINYPMGVCCVQFQGSEIVICPERFKENEIVFKNIANQFFGSTDNTMVFNEVKLKNIGSFDFVLVKHKPLSAKIEDFIIIEFQSDSTTGTGKLVNNLKDIFAKKKVDTSYAFGMNTYNTIKLSFIQMLVKGQVAEHWNKNIIWVMQDFIFSNMVNRFHLPRKSFDNQERNHFFLYSLKRLKDRFSLQPDDKHSYTITELKKAFENEHLPKLEDFIKILENKVRLKLEIK
jgi:hypothetical protein